MDESVGTILKDIASNLKILILAGLFGAFTRALVAPEKRWKRRLGQGAIGVLTAIFIGPILAGFLGGYVQKEVYAWLAAGYVCAFGGETIMSAIQNKILGEAKK